MAKVKQTTQRDSKSSEVAKGDGVASKFLKWPERLPFVQWRKRGSRRMNWIITPPEAFGDALYYGEDLAVLTLEASMCGD